MLEKNVSSKILRLASKMYSACSLLDEHNCLNCKENLSYSQENKNTTFNNLDFLKYEKERFFLIFFYLNRAAIVGTKIFLDYAKAIFLLC